MIIANDEIKSLLEKLPDESTLEDVQYHLYLVEKMHRSIGREATEGTICHDEMERNFSKGITLFNKLRGDNHARYTH